MPMRIAVQMEMEARILIDSKTAHSVETQNPRYIHSSDGVALAVWELGPEECDYVAVWVHANGFSSRMWLPVLRALECRPRTRHILYDLRGQGLSSKPDPNIDNYDWHRQACDLVEIIQALTKGDSRPVEAVGHSMGAAIIAIAASEVPELFASLSLFEPIIAIPERVAGWDPSANPLVPQARRRRFSFASVQECRERLGSKPPYSFFDPDVFELYVKTALVPDPSSRPAGVKLACPPEIEAVNYIAGGQHDGYARLVGLEHRILLMQGSRSPKGGFLDTSALASMKKNAIYREIEDATHFAPFERPKAFADAVCDFWEG